MFGNVMITTQIDYRNMQFMVYQDYQPQDNPLPAEVQRAVILQVIHDVAESFRRELRGQINEDPPSLKAHLIH